MTDDLDTLRTNIVLAALTHVAFDGWVERSLDQGAIDAGLPPMAAARAFPGGVIAAVRHWSEWSDRQTLSQLERRGLGAMRMRDRIAAGVRVRIDVNAGHREAVRRTMAFLSLPANLGVATRLAYGTVNVIWYAAGDSSTDFGFYTKRALLAPVYAATLLYWLDDESDDAVATWDFLSRRLDDVMQLSRLQATAAAVATTVLPPWSLRRRRASRQGV
jgi:ubiquinone biosynthesis protein COQ9